MNLDTLSLSKWYLTSIFHQKGKIYYDQKEYKKSIRDFKSSLDVNKIMSHEAVLSERPLATWLR